MVNAISPRKRIADLRALTLLPELCERGGRGVNRQALAGRERLALIEHAPTEGGEKKARRTVPIHIIEGRRGDEEPFVERGRKGGRRDVSCCGHLVRNGISLNNNTLLLRPSRSCRWS